MHRFTSLISYIKAHSTILLFTVASLVVGVFFALSIPLGYAEDESANIYRAYGVSRANFFPKVDGYEEIKGKQIPVYKVMIAGNLAELEWGALTDKTESYCYIGQPSYPGLSSTDRIYSSAGCRDSISKSQAVAQLASRPLDPQYGAFVATTSASGYVFIAYIPGAVGFSIAQILNTSTGTAIHLARVFTLLAYILITASALYILRNYRTRWIIFAVALLPGSLALAVTVNVDSMLLPISFLFFSLVMRGFLDTQNYSRNLRILLFACAILLPILKAPYGILSLAILLMPIYPPGRKGLLWRIGALALISIPALLYNLSIREADMAAQYLINPWAERGGRSNLWNVASDPLGFLELLSRSFLVSDWFASIGTLTQQRVRLPSTLIALSLSLVGVAAMAAYKDFAMLSRHKKTLLNIALLTGGILAIVSLPSLLHIRSSTITEIINIQGRYFIPMLPFLILSIALLLQLKLEGKRWSKAIFILLILSTVAISCVWYYLQVYVWAKPLP